MHEKLTLLETKPPLCDSLHSIAFDDIVLKSALSKLKNGKAIGIYNIPNEFLKNGGLIFQNALLHLFNKIKLIEQIPEDWFEGIVKPLYKDVSCEVLSNYNGPLK